MYKVFINDSSLSLRETATAGVQNYQGLPQLQEILEQLEQAQVPQHLELRSDDLKSLWADFRSQFQKIDAAGGMVKNEKAEILLIYRWEKWDLPKGKVEAGEELQQAAIREVMEECGVPAPKINFQLPSTFHTYERAGKKILKETYWFEMSLPKSVQLTPQTEEDITALGWFAPTEAAEKLRKSYASLYWLFQQYRTI